MKYLPTTTTTFPYQTCVLVLKFLRMRLIGHFLIYFNLSLFLFPLLWLQFPQYQSNAFSKSYLSPRLHSLSKMYHALNTEFLGSHEEGKHQLQLDKGNVQGVQDGKASVTIP